MADSARPSRFTLDRYTQMGDLTAALRPMVRQLRKWLGIVGAAYCGYLFLSNRPGAAAFAMIAVGAVIGLSTWCTRPLGVPLMPMLVLQHLAIYALPIVIGHEDVHRYSADHLFTAGREVIVFFLALSLAWRLAMTVMHPSPALAFTLQGLDRHGVRGLTRLGFALILAATGMLILQSAGLSDIIFGLLPNGSYPIVMATISATSACGFFLGSMIIGSGSASYLQRTVFWSFLTINCMLSATGLLLSGAATTVSAVMIGLLWGTGKVPWRFAVILITALSFLNLGKFTMRERYWQGAEDAPPPSVTLLSTPKLYAEWADASLSTLTGGDEEAAAAERIEDNKGQSLAERLNNLQNLLYVIAAMENGVPSLDGRTYTLIPPLLVPRILWPDKPRSHEGQVLLNTHFGRQDLLGTFQTYIAWGLLPEAYGNFGPITGAIFLGCLLGFFCAWLENLTTRKPVLSLEGFVSFTVFLGMLNSFEMVASVLITSIFQACVPLILAMLPFVARTVQSRPPPAGPAAA